PYRKVEIYYQDTWGTVCDDSWDLSDTNVVCKELGCGHAISAPGSAHYGQGSGEIWLDDVNCSGTETNLWACPSRGWGQHSCGHHEDAGVLCSESDPELIPVEPHSLCPSSLTLRLVNGADHCAGRVEVYNDGTWGTVCDDYWDLLASNVVCKQLGCGHIINVTVSAYYGEGSGQIWLDKVKCSGTESYIWECPSSRWGKNNCGHSDDAGVLCSGIGTMKLEYFPTGSKQIRLVNGADHCSGRVEIYYSGSWGTVCDNSWALSAANVVCKELGCGHAINAPGLAHYGEGSGQIWLDYMIIMVPSDLKVYESEKNLSMTVESLLPGHTILLIYTPDPRYSPRRYSADSRKAQSRQWIPN
uniref:SRCR domain-containing protein n=1 Tax=Terrapene triunguis TaxID=2587831 RepID=A0A674IJI3_9SAUR